MSITFAATGADLGLRRETTSGNREADPKGLVSCFISEFVLTYTPFRELEQSGNPIV